MMSFTMQFTDHVRITEYCAKKEVMFIRSLLEMIDGATFRNGEIQSLVALEWHAIRPQPKYIPFYYVTPISQFPIFAR